MNHLRFGAGLLAVLLAVSLWLGDSLAVLHDGPAQDLEKAIAAAAEENWPLANALCNRADKEWTQKRNLAAALYRHDPIDLIDAGFASLKSYAACEDISAFSGTCAQLARQLRSLPDNHSFRWWNLL